MSFLLVLAFLQLSIIQFIIYGTSAVINDNICKIISSDKSNNLISGKLKNLNVRITCLARGIPVGYSLENMDRITVYKALSERRPF